MGGGERGKSRMERTRESRRGGGETESGESGESGGRVMIGSRNTSFVVFLKIGVREFGIGLQSNPRKTEKKIELVVVEVRIDR
jgi:hypothetical protein